MRDAIVIRFLSREFLWAIIALVIAILLAYALVLLTPHDAQSEPAFSEYDARIVELQRESIETAYKEHIKKLFSIWVTDYSDEPPKAIKGAAQGRSAYIRAMRAIERREQSLPR